MDPLVLIQPLLRLWYFMLLMPLATILCSLWFKGHLGEFIVNVSVRLFLDKDRYHLIKNATLQREVGTTQIKQAAVSGHLTVPIQVQNTKRCGEECLLRKWPQTQVYKLTGNLDQLFQKSISWEKRRLSFTCRLD